MNWGYRILTVYLLFVAGIVTMAVLSFGQPLDMENENYYEAEKEQDDRMQQRRLGNAFRPLIRVRQTAKDVSFGLPADITEKPGLEGILKLTRPADAHLDRTFSFDQIQNGAISVEKSVLKPGFWKYSLEWSHRYGHYLVEDTLMLY